MPFITILFALDLIITGIVGFVATGKEHFTALIPCNAWCSHGCNYRICSNDFRRFDRLAKVSFRKYERFA